MQTEQEGPKRVVRRNHRGHEDGRYYEVNGKLYPSSTTILSAINKPALPAWAAKVEREAVLETVREVYATENIWENDADSFIGMIEHALPKKKAHKRLTDQAAEIGTEAHAWCEWWLKTELGGNEPEPQVRDEALWAGLAFRDWAKSVQLEPLAAEVRVWDEEHEYAGTLDFVAGATVEGKRRLLVGDVKTGKAIYDESRLQVASYIRARRCRDFDEGNNIPDKYDGIIVRLPKLIGDPAFEVAPIIEQPELDELLDTFDHVHALWRWMDRQDQAKKRGKRGVVAEAVTAS